MKPFASRLLAGLFAATVWFVALVVAPADANPAAVPTAPQQVTAAVNYGSGLFTPPTTTVKRTGDPGTADVLMVGDSITNACTPKLVAAFKAKGLTLAVIAQSGQNAYGLALLLTALSDYPGRIVFAGGTNDVFNPRGVLTGLGHLRNWAAATQVTVYTVDTYVGRPATLAHDIRNSGQVNGYLYSEAFPVISTVEALTAAVGRGRALNYYLRDGVHYWEAAATTPYNHGDGCAFLAATVAAGVK